MASLQGDMGNSQLSAPAVDGVAAITMNISSTLAPLAGSLANATVGPRPYPNGWQVALMWTLPILMIVLNILVFIVTPRMRSIRPCTGYGMLSLGAADFSLGIVHIIRMSFNTYTDYNMTETDPVCILDGYGQALFASISIATLTFMNVDRLLTIAFPLHYQRHLSQKRVTAVHVGIWVFMICLLAPTTTGAAGTSIKYYDYAFMCVPDWAGSLAYNMVVLVLVEIIPTGVIFVCFVGIFVLARRGAGKALRGKGSIKVHRGRARPAPGQTANGTADVATTSEDTQRKRDLRIFRTLAIMTFGFYVAWSPYFITVAIPEMIIGRSLHPVTDFISPWLGASNSFWNPLIYIPTMRPFYRAMILLFRPLAIQLCAPFEGCRKGGYTDCCDGGPTGSTALSSSNSGGTASTGVSNSAVAKGGESV